MVAALLHIEQGQRHIEVFALSLGMAQQRAHYALGAPADERVNQEQYALASRHDSKIPCGFRT
jgi:hypothetical protein